jgi:hypothetical protein
MEIDNTSVSFLEFAWDSLTEQQQYRIEMKYELKESLKIKEPLQSKRFIYRAIAKKYGYSMKQVERIAVEKL